MKHAVFTEFFLALPLGAIAQTPPPASPVAPAYRVEVIATTPLPGVDLPLEAIPAPAQTAMSRDIANSGALDLADFLNRRLTNIFVNETQGNPRWHAATRTARTSPTVRTTSGRATQPGTAL